MLRLLQYLMFPVFLMGLYHPVHYSVLTIDYNEADNSLDCVLKMFNDDLYAMAFHHYGDMVDEKSLRDSVQNNDFLERYINTMMWLVVDNSDTIHFRLTERTDHDEMMWARLRAAAPVNFSNLEMTNYLLMDVFPDQTNLVIWSRGGNEYGYQMTYESPKCTLETSPGI